MRHVRHHWASSGRRGMRRFLLEGLEPAGIPRVRFGGRCLCTPQGLVLEKAVGRIANLRTVVEKSERTRLQALATRAGPRTAAPA